MIGNSLSATVLAFAFGLLVGSAPRRLWAIAAAAAGALPGVLVALDTTPGNAAYEASWIIVAATAGVLYLRPSWRSYGAVALGPIGGFLVAESLASAPNPAAALAITAIAGALAAIASLILVRRDWDIALRVVAGWLIAASLLVAALPLGPAKPGYEQDHLE